MLMVSCLPLLGFSQKETDIALYIEQYKTIAIEEMNNYGIPASITIAQGIHESAAGKSKLAQNSNNHFGIKCHNDWNGTGYHHDDDAPQECFRVYETPEESYRDHSKFLLSRSWYKPLFSLSKTDYVGWAYGLKKAGYATNPKYPEVLIGLIEKYNLYLLDNAIDSTNTNAVPCGTIRKINGSKAILYNETFPIENLCACCGITTADLYLFNDADVRVSFKKGEYLFIEPKKTSGELCYYTVQEPTTYLQLSQKFGVQLSSLFRYNGEMEDRGLIVGETVNLCENKTGLNKRHRYIVKKGDSLYSIAKENKTTVEQLKAKNNIVDEKISIGQELITE